MRVILNNEITNRKHKCEKDWHEADHEEGKQGD